MDFKNKIRSFVYKFLNFPISGNISDISNAFLSSSYRKSFTYTDYIRLASETYNSNSDLQEAICKIVDNCKTLPLCLTDMNMGETKENFSKDLRAFLDMPSSQMGWKSFVEQALTQYLISGEILLFNNFMDTKKRNSLFLIMPNECLRVEKNNGDISKYLISESFFERVGLDKDMSNMINSNEKTSDLNLYDTKFTYKPSYNDVILKVLKDNKKVPLNFKAIEFNSEVTGSQMVNPVSHLFNYNPAYDERGLSFVITLIDSILTLNHGRIWNRSILENDGKPSGIFYYPANTANAINPSTSFLGKEKINERIQNQYSGPENAGKNLLLTGGMQWMATGQTSKEMDFLAGLQFSRDTIGNFFGIPLQLFGNQSASTYSNVNEAKYTFSMDTCLPLMNLFLEYLSLKILRPAKLINDNEFLAVNSSKAPHVSYRKFETMNMLKDINFLTINEKRESLGLKPVKELNADNIIIPSGNTTLEDLGIGMENDMSNDEPEDDNDVE